MFPEHKKALPKGKKKKKKWRCEPAATRRLRIREVVGFPACRSSTIVEAEERGRRRHAKRNRDD
jgi:hypothetical protein